MNASVNNFEKKVEVTSVVLRAELRRTFRQKFAPEAFSENVDCFIFTDVRPLTKNLD